VENDTLRSELARHEIVLPDDQIKQLDAYREILWDWNTKLNLTRHTDYERFVGRDIVDSLAIAEFLEPNERILDMGTGGGVPGIILAIVRPDLKVSLAESVGKRAKAVADIVERLDLKVPVYAKRAEDVLKIYRFNTVVVRAVAKLAKLLRWLDPCWGSFDRLLTLKGPSWVEERGEARHLGYLSKHDLRKLTSYTMHGTEAESVLLQVKPKE